MNFLFSKIPLPWAEITVVSSVMLTLYWEVVLDIKHPSYLEVQNLIEIPDLKTYGNSDCFWFFFYTRTQKKQKPFVAQFKTRYHCI